MNLRIVTSIVAGACTLVLAGCPAPEPVLPTAEFNADPVQGYAPLDVQFSDASTAGSAPLSAWYWNFGDAETSNQPSPSHTYFSVGKFTVTLRVVSAAGDGVASKSKLIEVLKPPTGPTAHFSADPENGPAPLAVQFIDESKSGDRAITSWRWDFGDGTQSEERHPVHAYEKSGEYIVTLFVDGPMGKAKRTKVWDVVVR